MVSSNSSDPNKTKLVRPFNFIAHTIFLTILCHKGTNIVLGGIIFQTSMCPSRWLGSILIEFQSQSLFI